MESEFHYIKWERGIIYMIFSQLELVNEWLESPSDQEAPSPGKSRVSVDCVASSKLDRMYRMSV